MRSQMQNSGEKLVMDVMHNIVGVYGIFIF